MTDLRRMYSLLLRIQALDQLKSDFERHVVQQGVKAVEMVQAEAIKVCLSLPLSPLFR